MALKNRVKGPEDKVEGKKVQEILRWTPLSEGIFGRSAGIDVRHVEKAAKGVSVFELTYEDGTVKSFRCRQYEPGKIETRI
ncbi:hypothetical protein H0O00_01700 [Candidatus Micrarchaeota archaeon]|nr:hypothetical protein [Candidatus Micrarchaeota archaeon]